MELFRPRVHGVFLKPGLIFRSPSMSFHHVHDMAAEEAISGKLMGNTAVSPAQSLLLPIEKLNSVTNESELLLSLRHDGTTLFCFVR
jgi:hypothetical protein